MIWMQETGDHCFGWEWVCSDLQVDMAKITHHFLVYNMGPYQLKQEQNADSIVCITYFHLAIGDTP